MSSPKLPWHLSRRLWVSVVGPLMLTGCARDAAPTEVPSPIQATSSEGPAALSNDALARLPEVMRSPALGVAAADAPWFVSFRFGARPDPTALEELIARDPETFGASREEITNGVALLGQFAAASDGAEGARLAGFFPHGSSFIVFMSVSDPGLFLKNLEDRASSLGMTPVRKVAGNTIKLTVDSNDFAALVRDGVLYFVAGDGGLPPYKNPSEVVAQLQAAEPQNSLGASQAILNPAATVVAGGFALYVRR